MTENTTSEQNTEAIAESITQTFNPFEQTDTEVNDGFAQESFFENNQEAEAASLQAQPEQPIVEVAASLDNDDEGDPVDWLNEQWRDKGVKISSLDEIPAIINEYNRMKAEKPAGLSSEEQARIKLGRETGNWQLYDQIISIDTKTIDSREAMKTKFILEKPGMPRQLAETLFEKELRRVISEDDSEETIQQYLEYEGANAKKWLDEKKASINIAEDSTVEEKSNESDGDWFKGVDSVIDQIVLDKNQITYELEDGKSVNVVIDREQLQELKDSMDSPQGWIRDNILNEQGGWDYAKLMQLIIKNMHSEIISKEFYELGRVHQEQHLLNKQRGVTTQATATGAPRNNVDPRDNVAQAFNKFKTGF